jgi:hypothetical protein
MRYLAVLLAGPGRPIAARTLVAEGAPLPEGPRHDVLDPAARAAYAARVRELDAEVAEAESGHDLARAERLRAERDAVVEQLAAATGLAGRPRAFVDDAERARTAVRKSLKRAIDQLAAADERIGAHLRASVMTGTTCVYAPPAGDEVTWSTAMRRPFG